MLTPCCPQGQGHVFSQLPSRQQAAGSQMLSRESGCWTAWDPGRALFSHGEEMINQGSCLLSTWNIPGTVTKTVCHTLFNPKNSPRKMVVCVTGEETDSEVKHWPNITRHRARFLVLGFLTPFPWGLLTAFQLDWSLCREVDLLGYK